MQLLQAARANTPHPPNNNSYSAATTTTTAATTTTTTPTTIPGIENIMSKEQIVSTMEEILAADLSTKTPVTDYTRQIWAKAAEVNKSVYYYLTGRTFEQDKFITRVFSLKEDLREEEYFPDIYLKEDGTPKIGGTISKTLDGTTIIFAIGTPNMHADSSSRDFVFILANETGNAWDSKVLEPNDSFSFDWKDVKIKNNETIGHYMNIYLEASKKAYQGAFTRFLEEIGIDLSPADTPENREALRNGDKALRGYFDKLGEPYKGYYIMWAIALQNPEISSEMEKNKKLNSASSMKLHDIIIKELSTHADFIERAQAMLKPEVGDEILRCVYNQLVPNGKIQKIRPADIYWFFEP